VATDGSKNLVSVTNTGSGNNVLATSPTFTTGTTITTGTNGILNGSTSNYGYTSFNGSTSLTGMTGIFGGASGDAATLYHQAPTGGLHDFRVAGTDALSLTETVATFSSLAGTGTRMVVASNTGAISTQAIPGGGGGSVTGVAVGTSNGFAGTSDGNAVVPTLTLTTTVNGMAKGNGTALSAATANTDYTLLNGTGLVSVNGSTTPVYNTTSSAISGIISDETGSGAMVFGTSPTIATPTVTGSLTNSNSIPFVLSSPTTVDFHQSGAGTVRFVNDAFSAVNMSITNAGDVGVRGALTVTGAASASNLSGTNTGDQTTITGNAATATALQTARNIQGVSFNGTADINPINGTGFVKASGTTLSYDNSTYLTGNQTVTLSGAVTGSGATSISTTLASGIAATKIADGSVTSTEFQYINTLSSNAQNQIDAKAPLASPALTGNPTAPTQTAGDNSTKIATTAYVDATATVGSGASKQSDVIFKDENSSSAGAIDLAQHTISTATNGDKISFEYTGNFAANTNSKPQMILTVDGTDFTIPSITPGNNEDWIISGSIIRVSSTIYKISINYFQSGQNNYPQVTSGATLDTNSLVITLTAPTTVANNDIVLSTASIQKFNAP